jgi:lathosterol oxidase
MMTDSAGQRDDARRRALGRRWLPGIVSAFLGALGLLAVVCLHFPAWTTTPELRAIYPMALVRTAIATGLAAALAIGAFAVLLDRGRRLGLAGLALAGAAQLAGGASVEVALPVARRSHLGLDWFVLDLFVLALVAVPIERAFAQRPAQPVFRRGWRTDLAHFFASHVLVSVLSLLTIAPALLLFRVAGSPALQAAVAAQPLALQLAEIVLVADLSGYAAHRLFHAVPVLWRFHAVHHSSEAMDWLAGSRLHLVDVVATRAAVFAPLFLLGFAHAALTAYLVWVALHATWIHANLRFRYGPLEHVLATPRFHHWHHAADRAARDKNFAVHLPFIDRVFGTYYLPEGRWPARYGIDEPMPAGWLGQLAAPFR